MVIPVQRTVFSTPVFKHFFYGIAWLWIKLAGWRLEGAPPSEKKYILIAVPHTSNWDFPFTLALAFLYNMKIYWLGKASLFKWGLGPVMKWLGGIPVERSVSNNLVQKMIEIYNAAEELVITVPAEGTRSKVDRWKTGFYYIAQGAKVPIARGFLDYKRKVGGFGSTFYPTGDFQKDLAEIKAFYIQKFGPQVA